MSFETAFQKIQEGVSDLSQLNVRTFTGDINVSGSDLSDVNLTDLLSNDGVDVQVTVVGITNIKLDGDVDQFISNSPNVKPVAINAHNKAIESGSNTRKAMFDMFSGLVKKSINAIGN